MLSVRCATPANALTPNTSSGTDVCLGLSHQHWVRCWNNNSQCCEWCCWEGRSAGEGGGGSLLTVSLKSCGGEPGLKTGGGGGGGGEFAVRQLEVSACRSGSGLTLRRGARPCFSGEIQRVLTVSALTLQRYQRDRGHIEHTWMDRGRLHSEWTCQPVRGISGYNGEYDT